MSKGDGHVAQEAQRSVLEYGGVQGTVLWDVYVYVCVGGGVEEVGRDRECSVWEIEKARTVVQWELGKQRMQWRRNWEGSEYIAAGVGNVYRECTVRGAELVRSEEQELERQKVQLVYSSILQ